MSEAMSCSQCKSWRKHRLRNSNWGTCIQIVATVDNDSKVHLAGFNPELCTHEAFFCSEFVQKPIVSKPSLVDTVREAARSYHKQLKEQ